MKKNKKEDYYLNRLRYFVISAFVSPIALYFSIELSIGINILVTQHNYYFWVWVVSVAIASLIGIFVYLNYALLIMLLYNPKRKRF